MHEILRTIVEDSEAFSDPDFTRMLLLHGKKQINFELPKSLELSKGDRVVFYNCEIQQGNKCLYIGNRNYGRLEIYFKYKKNPCFELEGSQGARLERLALRESKK